MATSRPYIGGQAVLEGVMMRAPSSFAVVVRRRDGSLHVRERAMRAGPAGAARWPLVRGVLSLVESLRLGSEALRFSADQWESDMRALGAGTQLFGVLRILRALAIALVAMATHEDGAPPEHGRGGGGGAGGSRAATWVMLAVFLGFFIALPQAFAAGVDRVMGLHLPVQSARFQLITGVFKFAIVIGYLLAIRRIPDIRRVFQYHGAEHKTISTYEAGEPLTVQHARRHTTLHPRCGTTFLVMVVLVSVIAFTALGAALPRIETGSWLLNNLAFLVAKLLFLPAIVAVTFEIQRIFARTCTRGPLRVLLWPGFLVQRITTAEPDDDQLEVALASLRVTLARERGQAGGQAWAGADDVAFASFGALLAGGDSSPAL
jgi:uncharacterized protein YqhQ